jgi:hypothetical protein
MFIPSEDDLQLADAALHGLRLSLNTPVLSVEELPDGPARAAIVLYAGAYGALTLAVGLRSLRADRIAFYAWCGALDLDSVPHAWEGALGFCESLGFLFDDDVLAVVSPEARRRAHALWTSFRGPALSSGATQEPAVADGGFGDIPLEIDPEELDTGIDPGGDAETELSRSRPRPARAEPAETASNGGAGPALGRVPIVKRRAGPDEAEAVHPLVHVLGSY